MLCTKACKAEAPSGSGCPDQRACDFYWNDPNGAPDSGDEYWYTDCRATGTGGDAASCATNGGADCQAGFGCFSMTYSDETVKDECRQICVWSVNGSDGLRRCAAGSCHQVEGGLVVAGTEYGICY
jgi:hypothetical protein